MLSNRKFYFSIFIRAHNDEESFRDQQLLNSKLGITHYYSITANIINFCNKQSHCMIKFNNKSNSDDNNQNVKFMNVDFPCNNPTIQLLAHNSITRI